MLAGLTRVTNVYRGALVHFRAFDWKPLLLPLSIFGVLAIIGSFVLARSHGYDLIAYWIVNPADPYGANRWEQGGFNYAPPAALLLAPLGMLSWEAAQLLWLGLQLVALWYVGRRWFLVLVLFPPVWLDITYGNINIFLAAMIVAGLRHPGVWAFGLLTKVTPGIGLVWFAVRRQWGKLATGLGVTVVVIVLSLLVQGPRVWMDWFDVLSQSGNIPSETSLPIPLLPRLAISGIVLAWAGIGNRTWVLPLAVTLAMPTLWLIAFAPLVSLFRPPDERGLIDADRTV